MIDLVGDLDPALLAALRQVFREEIATMLPRLEPPPVLMTIRECGLRYRRPYRFVRDLIDTGTLKAICRTEGKRGRGKGQYFIDTASAESHPQLGGAL